MVVPPPFTPWNSSCNQSYVLIRLREEKHAFLLHAQNVVKIPVDNRVYKDNCLHSIVGYKSACLNKYTELSDRTTNSSLD